MHSAYIHTASSYMEPTNTRMGGTELPTNTATGIRGSHQPLTHFHQSNHDIRERGLCPGCVFTVGFGAPSHFRDIWGGGKSQQTSPEL